MNRLELSQSLKKQADALIERKALNRFLAKFGDVVYTGSYALDLMTWRDIDLQLKLSHSQEKRKVIGNILSHMAQDQDVIYLQYTDSLKKTHPNMPEGQYLQFKIQDEDEVWKMDLWLLTEADFDQNRNFMNRLEEGLAKNKSAKDLILEMKFALMGENSRPPTMASYHLYQAIVFNNITDPQQIKDYIKSKGVKI